MRADNDLVYFRSLSGLLILLMISACNRAPVASVSLSRAPLLPAAAALSAARDDLSPGGAGPFAPASAGTSSLSGTPYQPTRADGAALHLTLRQPLRQRGAQTLGLVGVIGLGGASRAWHLPQGLGVLTDPIDVRVSSRTLSAELRLQAEGPVSLPYLGPLQIERYAGIGVMQARSRTRLDSALLAYQHRSTRTQPYLTAGVTLVGTGQGPVTPALGLRLTGSRLAGIEAALQLDLRH